MIPDDQPHLVIDKAPWAGWKIIAAILLAIAAIMAFQVIKSLMGDKNSLIATQSDLIADQAADIAELQAAQAEATAITTCRARYALDTNDAWSDLTIVFTDIVNALSEQRPTADLVKLSGVYKTRLANAKVAQEFYTNNPVLPCPFKSTKGP